MANIAVIIPVGKDERAHEKLQQVFEEFEVIASKGSSRANAMNLGAQKTDAEFLWFVHADTELSQLHIEALKNALKDNPDCLHYFDLKFSGEASKLIKLNEIGANIRSRFLGIPWGDQVFCISKQLFEKLGKYDENAEYGEDHLLVWKAHQQGVKLNRIAEPIITSARKYKQVGWLKLTALRQYLWLKQAIPELWKLAKIKVGL